MARFSRRDALWGTAALPAAVLTTAAPPPHPDAPLLAAIGDLRAIDRRAVWFEEAPLEELTLERQAEWRALIQRWDRTAGQVSRLPATTDEGRRAKAAYLLDQWPTVQGQPCFQSPWERMRHSLLRDVAGSAAT